MLTNDDKNDKIYKREIKNTQNGSDLHSERLLAGVETNSCV